MSSMNPPLPKPETPTYPGDSTLVRIAPAGQPTQTAIFIRDSTGAITSFGRNPGISGRFEGIDYQEDVLVVVILLRVRTPKEPAYYQLWLNLQDQRTSTALFVDLAVQTHLTFQFFGTGGRTMTACVMNNPFREFARNVLNKLQQYKRWTPEKYLEAEQALRSRFTTSASLWNSLGKPASTVPLIHPSKPLPSS